MRALIGRVGSALVILSVSSYAALGQSADTTHRYSVYSGATLAALDGDFSHALSDYVGFGASRDFGTGDGPITTRVTVSYDHWQTSGVPATTRVASAVGEAVYQPGELVSGVRPYLFGGLGVLTRLSASGVGSAGNGLTAVNNGTSSYAGWSVGGGVEAGRTFVQYRFMTAFTNGPKFAGFNLGFRL